jgi:predicted metalloprotease
MKWRGRRASSNVEDARGRRAAAVTAGLGMLVDLVGRRFGVKGILALLVVGFVGWQMGLLDPALMTDGTAPMQQADVDVSPEEQTRYEFVRVVLADTEDIWGREFARADLQYLEPSLVVYRDRYPTDCGMGDARMGPFYCPADRRIYIDLGFYDALAQQFEAPGDFAQAYVIAHEVGHHVQNLLGISEQVQARRGQPDYNEYSVRLELQADYLAGVWAHHNRQYLDRGDIEEAMQAANQIGDDAIQARTQGRVVPHAFTHGTSRQRMHWFNLGLESGRMEDGDTFALPYRNL